MPKETILKGIADNPALMEELKKLLLEEFTLNNVEKTTTNEILGQIVRANLTGKDAIERAFSKILEYKTIEPKTRGEMPAR